MSYIVSLLPKEKLLTQNKKGCGFNPHPKEQRLMTLTHRRVMKTIQEIQEKIYMAQDKIKWAKMFIAHAESQLYELQELTMDKEEEEWLDRISRENRGF